MHLVHALYSAMWSNMWAPSIPTIASVAVSHVLHRKHRTRLHAELREHLDERLRQHLGGGV